MEPTLIESRHLLPELALVGNDLSHAFDVARAGGAVPMDLRAADRLGPCPPSAGTDPGDPQHIFLDIETTGLSAGPSTLVVLVGLGFFDGDQLVVRQYVLDEPGLERRLLAGVGEALGASDALVTFNGKSFDVPMLTGRFNLHRLADPTPPLHLDLLHPARRIWRRRLRQCGLGALEARILGVVRESDIPGSDIPRRYYDFVRDRSWDAFTPVLDHNRQDVVSLARLALRVEALLRGDHDVHRPSPSDFLGLGALHEVASRPATARGCYERALASSLASDRVEALYRLGTLAHRDEDLDRTIEVFDAVTRYQTRQALLAAIELAKLHEHRTGDLAKALSYAHRAAELVAQHGPAAGAGTAEEVERRVARLRRKAGAASRNLGGDGGRGSWP